MRIAILFSGLFPFHSSRWQILSLYSGSALSGFVGGFLAYAISYSMQCSIIISQVRF